MSRRATPHIVEYKNTKFPNSRFGIDFYADEKRVRKFFATEPEAQKELARMKKKLRQGGENALAVSDSARIAAYEAEKMLAPYPGETILKAIEFYLCHLKTKETSVPIRQLVDEYLVEQKRLNRSPEHQTDLRNRYAIFCETFGETGTRVLTGKQIKDWITKTKLGEQSKNNYRTRIKSLCQFAVESGYMSKNPVDFKPISFDSGPPEILTVEQLTALLEHASPKLLPALAIKAFAGVRTRELPRLTWEDVKFARGFIEVSKGKSKMKRRRLIPIEPNLMEWLSPFKGLTGPVWNGTEHALLVALSALEKVSGVTIPNNALRHSYASYHLALFQDENKTALAMGNSPAVIFSDYRELVYPDDAKAYFSIRPPTVAENVVSMTA
jgi:integrase